MEAPRTLGESDKYRVFELSTPFARINVNQFLVLMKMAANDAGDEGFVTLTTLRTHLKTPAWQPLEDEGSTISRFLLSPAFKADGLAADQIGC